MKEISIGDIMSIDAVLEEIPNRPAVFLLWPRDGAPYLARTNTLRRRLLRLLGTPEKPSRALQLRDTAVRIEYRFTGSKLEAQFLLWELARRYLGADYRRLIRLRLPPYVKLILSNRFPRTQLTARIGKSPALYFGPFRNRATAARFESEFLDLFQLRRCQEDLAPRPDHPGCIYGEMGRCLRPCQQAVGVEEYAGEVRRVSDFLRTGGKSLLEAAAASRDRLSAEMDFEGAALAHERWQRIENVLGLRDEMAREVNSLHAIAVLPSSESHCVELGWLKKGYWQGFSRLEFNLTEERPVSLDARLRELANSVAEALCPAVERVERLAILARWFYSSWRDGEMLLLDDWEKIPYRKLVNAVSRVARAQQQPHPSTRS